MNYLKNNILKFMSYLLENMFKKLKPSNSNEKPNITLSFDSCPSIDYTQMINNLKGLKIGSNVISK